MPKRRIFIAIQVPEELKNAAEFYLKPFFDDKNIRIPKKEGWHITLVFCGYLEEEELKKVKEIVGNIASNTNSFEISPDKILFYPPKRPRMVWLAFEASPQFSQLKKEIEDGIISFQARGTIQKFQSRLSRESSFDFGRFEENYFSNIKKFFPKRS